jgi:hypothetical protein
MKRERLIQGRSDAGRALAAFDTRTADASPGAEERAWRILQARLTAPPSRRWLIGPAAALVAGAAAALVLALLPAGRAVVRAPPAPPALVPSPRALAPPAPAPAPAAEPPAVVLPSRLRPLSGGPIRLAGGAVLSLGAHTRARGRQQARETQLVLESGTLNLAVTANPPDAGVSVRAGPYRFVDLGTVFRVSRKGGRVSLWVDQGMVAVWRGSRLLATVNAGGRWSSGPASIPMVADAPPPPDPVRTCTFLLAGGTALDAVACYRRLAAGETLVAETALYEAARLQAQQLHDLPGALASLREHRHRFPGGALRAEADLSLVELLPRLGRFREALDESGALLAREPRHERAAELHLLRGNILRESFRDYRRAEREYAAVRDAARAGDTSTIADDAAFFQAVCLEAGSRHEAADAYRRYLARAAPGHAAAARQRLSALLR